MRSIFFVLAGFMVMGLAFWSYQENYKTRDTISDVRQLHAQIGANHERLGMLKAEWAYLNRPERLRNLVDLNFEVLGLMPLSASHFGDADKVSYPPLDMDDLVNPVDLSAQFDGVDAEVPE